MLAACDELAQSSAKIVRAPKPLTVDPKYHEMKNVADAVRKRMGEGNLLDAIEELTSAMDVPVDTIITPKKKFRF